MPKYENFSKQKSKTHQSFNVLYRKRKYPAYNQIQFDSIKADGM